MFLNFNKNLKKRFLITSMASNDEALGFLEERRSQQEQQDDMWSVPDPKNSILQLSMFDRLICRLSS